MAAPPGGGSAAGARHGDAPAAGGAERGAGAFRLPQPPHGDTAGALRLDDAALSPPADRAVTWAPCARSHALAAARSVSGRPALAADVCALAPAWAKRAGAPRGDHPGAA